MLTNVMSSKEWWDKTVFESATLEPYRNQAYRMATVLAKRGHVALIEYRMPKGHYYMNFIRCPKNDSLTIEEQNSASNFYSYSTCTVRSIPMHWLEYMVNNKLNWSYIYGSPAQVIDYRKNRKWNSVHGRWDYIPTEPLTDMTQIPHSYGFYSNG